MGVIASVSSTRAYDVARVVGSAYLLMLPALPAVYCLVSVGRWPGARPGWRW